MKNIYSAFLAAVTLCLLAGTPAHPRDEAAKKDPNETIDPALLKGLQYRSLDFSRGGRVTAVAGVPGKPLSYYFGSTGGGVWKTEDAGITWKNVSDGFFEAGSIGALAVAPSDPNVVYAGTGSACPRGNISTGVGMYRSSDAGKTWMHSGLPEAGQIGRVAVHPKNHDLVYVAALGHIFGPNEERGVFRSADGGKTWDKVLFVSDRTGAVDLSMDPGNPRVIYAALWTVERKPWTIDSGSEESGLYKTSDGGDTWKKLGQGLPSGVVGKIGVAVSPADPQRVWALIEAPEDRGGIYRSDNGGESWRRVNSERRFLQRAWYYIHIHADTQHPEIVYVLNTGFYKSTDGGKTFQSVRVPHGDVHDLWINPADPQKMISGNDGGASVSFNGGASWSSQMNQPTAEFYRVTVDNQFPYRVYGAQQDNSTASIPSRGLYREDQAFYSVGGGESGHIAVDPRNPNIVYAGSYGGSITRVDTSTNTVDSIRIYPESAPGQRAADLKYRFQWNAPIRLSPHDPDTLYHCSQFVHRSRDAGRSWEVISPDLSRNDKGRQDYSGRPITRDNTGAEVFGTIFAFEESPHSKGLLWAGSDDGRVHISRDGGAHWQEITPGNMPESGTVNMIELSAHDPGRAFIAVHRYREDDNQPHIFRTSDYGRSWDLLTDGANGIPADRFVRVVREDPGRKGLLYAGTEFGMYISFDDGIHWQPFQLNLPITPVTDLAVHQQDLVVATQGRAFWVLEDLTPLHQINDRVLASPVHLFAPRPAVRTQGYAAWIHYYLQEEAEEAVSLEIVDARGKVVDSFSSKPVEEEEAGPRGEDEEDSPFRRSRGDRKVSGKKGMNRFTWNPAFPAPFKIPSGTVMWAGGGSSGPKLVPGAYAVRLTIGDRSQTQPLEVVPDPRIETTAAEYQEQFELAIRIGARIKELYGSLLKLRDARKQANEIAQRMEKAGYGKEALVAAKSLSDKLGRIEGELTQLEGEGGQDALNFPGRLDNQFVALYSEVARGDRRPSAGARQRLADINPELTSLLGRLEEVFKGDLAKFNQLVRNKDVPPVILAK